MKKMIIFLVTMLCMIGLGMINTSAEVVTGSCGTNVTYSLDKEMCVLTISGTGDMEDYNYFDSSNKAPWNDYRDYIKMVIIQEGVTGVGNYAFYSCKQLQKVSFSESVTRIGGSSFSYCVMTNVELPEKISYIGGYAFVNCNSMESITLPNSVTYIGEGAFSRTALSSVILPNGIKELATSTFNNCKRLESIKIPNEVTAICQMSFYGCIKLNCFDTLKTGNTYCVGLTPMGENTRLDVENFAKYIRINNNNSQVSAAVTLTDNEDGTYTLTFNLNNVG